MVTLIIFTTFSSYFNFICPCFDRLYMQNLCPEIKLLISNLLGPYTEGPHFQIVLGRRVTYTSCFPALFVFPGLLGVAIATA